MKSSELRHGAWFAGSSAAAIKGNLPSCTFLWALEGLFGNSGDWIALMSDVFKQSAH